MKTSIIRSLLLGAGACAACSCGPIGATSVIGDAEIAVARAHTEGGDRYAIYETTSADLLLQKAREEQGYAHYAAASDLAHKSVLLAETATRKSAEGKKNPDTSPAPTAFESTKASTEPRPQAPPDAAKPQPPPEQPKPSAPPEQARPTAPTEPPMPMPPRVVKPGDPVPQDPPPPPRAPQPKPEPIKAEPAAPETKADGGPAEDQPRRVIKPGDAQPAAPARERKVPIEIVEPGDKR